MGGRDAREQARNQRYQREQREKQKKKKEQLTCAVPPMPSSGNSYAEMGSVIGTLASITLESVEEMFNMTMGGAWTISKETPADKAERKAQRKAEGEKKAKEALARLYAMPGMGHLKSQVEEIIALKEMSEKRIAMGLKAEPQTLHMTFEGPPGTGKTTAARLIGQAFIQMGLLKSDHDVPPFVEVHFDEIESKYFNVDVENLKKKFNEAKGGVLFLDEAYAFISPYAHSKTLIAALVSLIEDHRDEVMVVAAGYPAEMEKFLDFNPGLRSRFANKVSFPHYELEPLLEIAELMAKERDYTIGLSAVASLMKRLEGERKLASFGNARTVRNVIEEAIRRQSVRLRTVENPTKEDMMAIIGADINTEVRKPLEISQEEKQKQQQRKSQFPEGFDGAITFVIGPDKPNPGNRK
jgi:stage V sporulation protein K